MNDLFCIAFFIFLDKIFNSIKLIHWETLLFVNIVPDMTFKYCLCEAHNLFLFLLTDLIFLWKNIFVSVLVYLFSKYFGKSFCSQFWQQRRVILHHSNWFNFIIFNCHDFFIFFCWLIDFFDHFFVFSLFD